jgi:hypothetical protein
MMAPIPVLMAFLIRFKLIPNNTPIFLLIPLVYPIQAGKSSRTFALSTWWMRAELDFSTRV